MMGKKAVILLVMLAVTTGSARAQGGSEQVQPVDVYLRSARIALMSDDFPRATRNLEIARRHYPDNYEVHFLLGTIWAEKDEIDSMVSEYVLAEEYASQKQWKKRAKKILQIYDDKWIKRYNRAVALFSHADSVIEVADGSDDAHRADSLRGVIKQIQQLAIEKLSHCALLRPDDFRGKSTRGLIYQRQGRVEESMQDFIEAERLVHRHEFEDSTTDWSDTTTFFQGPEGKATDAFKKYQSKYKKLSEEKRTRYRNLMLSLGAAYYDSQLWPECIALFRRIHGLFPKDINAIVTLADVFARLENETEAFKWQESVVRENPNSKDTWYNLGIFFYNTAIRLQDSVARYDRMASANDDPDARSAYLTHAERSIDNFSKAIPRFERVVEIDTKDEETRRLVAVSYFSLASLLAGVEAKADEAEKKATMARIWESLRTLLNDKFLPETQWEQVHDTLLPVADLFPDDEGLCRMMKVTLARLRRVEELREWGSRCP